MISMFQLCFFRQKKKLPNFLTSILFVDLCFCLSAKNSIEIFLKNGNPEFYWQLVNSPWISPLIHFLPTLALTTTTPCPPNIMIWSEVPFFSVIVFSVALTKNSAVLAVTLQVAKFFADISGRLLAVSEKAVIIASAIVNNFIFIIVSLAKRCWKDK